jgi:two-component system response regulator NreC
MGIAKKKLNFDFFSSREMEVLDLIKEGLTSREIARRLDLSEDTIEGHRRNMIKKSGGRNMIVVVYAAKSIGLI